MALCSAIALARRALDAPLHPGMTCLRRAIILCWVKQGLLEVGIIFVVVSHPWLFLNVHHLLLRVSSYGPSLTRQANDAIEDRILRTVFFVRVLRFLVVYIDKDSGWRHRDDSMLINRVVFNNFHIVLIRRDVSLPEQAKMMGVFSWVMNGLHQLTWRHVGRGHNLAQSVGLDQLHRAKLQGLLALLECDERCWLNCVILCFLSS